VVPGVGRAGLAELDTRRPERLVAALLCPIICLLGPKRLRERASPIEPGKKALIGAGREVAYDGWIPLMVG
jgi:hypothetical protein